MYEWIENQIELIGDDSHEYSETPEVQTAVAEALLFQLETMLESKMMGDHLPIKDVKYLLGYLRTIRAIVVEREQE